MNHDLPSLRRGDSTRDALIAAAITVFSRDGFHAASTRAIALEAGANQALIGYHFGGKQGLYHAVFEFITAKMTSRMSPLVTEIMGLLTTDGPAVATREQLTDALLRVTDAMAALLASEHSADWAQLILREQQRPTSAFELIYSAFMVRVLGVLSALIHRIRGGEEIDARLLATTVLGQVLVFRAAREGVTRFIGWDDIAEGELKAIQKQVRLNVRTLLTASE